MGKVGVLTIILLALLCGCRSSSPEIAPDPDPGGGSGSAVPRVHSVTPAGGLTGSNVQFFCNASGASPLTYSWDFGGAGTPNMSSDAAPDITLGAGGTYAGNLHLQNADGVSDYQFTIIVTGYTAAGSVVSLSEHGMDGVQLIINGNGGGVATTDSDGGWQLNDLPNGTYTVSPYRSDWNFDPPLREFTIDGNDVHGLWFYFIGTQQTAVDWLHTLEFEEHSIGAIDIAINSNNTVIAVSSSNYDPGVCLANYTLDGKLNWAKTIDLAGSYGRLAAGPQDNTSFVLNIDTFEYHAQDVLLQQLDQSGAIARQVVFGASTDLEIHALECSPDGRLYLVGTKESLSGTNCAVVLCFNDVLDFQWGKQWSSSGDVNEANGIDVAADGSLYVACTTNGFGDSGGSSLLLHISSSGGLLWQKTWELIHSVETISVACDSSNNAHVLCMEYGYSQQPCNVLKYSPAGELLWAKNLPGFPSDNPVNLDVSAGGKVFITGKGQISTFDFFADNSLVTRLASDGSLDWTLALLGDEYPTLQSVVSYADESVLVGGNGVNTACYWSQPADQVHAGFGISTDVAGLWDDLGSITTGTLELAVEDAEIVQDRATRGSSLLLSRITRD